MEMTGGEAVAAALELLSVRHVFGIVSVHNLPIYDAIARRGTPPTATRAPPGSWAWSSPAPGRARPTP
jgi:acetolactate synthase I/II/III large subunit